MIIQIIGRSSAGKDVFAHILQHILADPTATDFEVEQTAKMRLPLNSNPQSQGSGASLFEIKSIKGKFLEYTCTILGIETPKEYNTLKENGSFENYYSMGKSMFGEDIWAKFLLYEYSSKLKSPFTYTKPKWIISDVKYVEDYEHICSFDNVKTIRVDRYKYFDEWCDDFGIDIIRLPQNLVEMSFPDFMFNLDEAMKIAAVVCSNEKYLDIHLNYFDSKEQKLDRKKFHWNVKNNNIQSMISQCREIVKNIVR